MQIELSNINKIKHASIEVGGLTVITGINDSGKSTAGNIIGKTKSTNFPNEKYKKRRSNTL